MFAQRFGELVDRARLHAVQHLEQALFRPGLPRARDQREAERGEDVNLRVEVMRDRGDGWFHGAVPLCAGFCSTSRTAMSKKIPALYDLTISSTASRSRLLAVIPLPLSAATIIRARLYSGSSLKAIIVSSSMNTPI